MLLVSWKCELLSHVWLFVTPWTVACQAPPSMGFCRQEYWSGLVFPSTGCLPDPGIKPRSPEWTGRYHLSHHGSPYFSVFGSVQSLSRVQLFATSWSTAHQTYLSITNSQSLLKLMSIEVVVPSNHLILSSPSPPALNLFQYQLFSNESALHNRWPKYWSFSFNNSPSSEHPWLISFRMDWLDLLAVQGTLKSLLQHHSSKASVLCHSAFFIVQHSYPYMTTGKTIA